MRNIHFFLMGSTCLYTTPVRLAIMSYGRIGYDTKHMFLPEVENMPLHIYNPCKGTMTHGWATVYNQCPGLLESPTRFVVWTNYCRLHNSATGIYDLNTLGLRCPSFFLRRLHKEDTDGEPTNPYCTHSGDIYCVGCAQALRCSVVPAAVRRIVHHAKTAVVVCVMTPDIDG